MRGFTHAAYFIFSRTELLTDRENYKGNILQIPFKRDYTLEKKGNWLEI